MREKSSTVAEKSPARPGAVEDVIPSQTGDDIVELTASLAAISRQFNQATVRNDSLQKQIEGLLGKQRTIQSSRDAAQHEVEKVLNENLDLKQQLHFAETRIEIQAACINELQLKIKALSEEQARLNTVLRTANQVATIKRSNTSSAQPSSSAVRDGQSIVTPPKMAVYPTDGPPYSVLPTPAEDVTMAEKSKEGETSSISQSPIPQPQDTHTTNADDNGEDGLVRWQDVIRMHHPGALSSLKKPQRERVMEDIREWLKQHLNPEVAAICIAGVTRKKRQNFRTRGTAAKRHKSVVDAPNGAEPSSDAPGEADEDEAYVRDLAIPRRFAEQVMLYIESKFIEGRYTTVTLRRDRRQSGISPVPSRSPEKSPEMPIPATQLPAKALSTATTLVAPGVKERILVRSERSLKLPVTVQIPNKRNQIEGSTGESSQLTGSGGQETMTRCSIVSELTTNGSGGPQNHDDESDEDQLWPSEGEYGAHQPNSLNATNDMLNSSPTKRKRLNSISSAESASPVRRTQKSRRVVRVIRDSEECAEEGEMRRDEVEPTQPADGSMNTAVNTNGDIVNINPPVPTRSSPRRNNHAVTATQPMIVDISSSSPLTFLVQAGTLSTEDKHVEKAAFEDGSVVEKNNDILQDGNDANADDPLLSFVDDMMMLSPSLVPTPADGIAEQVIAISLDHEAVHAAVLASEPDISLAEEQSERMFVEDDRFSSAPTQSGPPQKSKIASGTKLNLNIEKAGLASKRKKKGRKTIKGTFPVIVDTSGRPSSSESSDGPASVRNSPAALSAENHSATTLPPLTLPKFKKRPNFPAPPASSENDPASNAPDAQNQPDQGSAPARSTVTDSTPVPLAIDLRGPRVPYMTVIDTIIPNHRSLNKKWQGKIRFHVKAWLSEKVGADRFESVCKLDVNDGKDWTYGVPRSLVQNFRTWFQEQNFLERYAAYLKAAPTAAGDGYQQQKPQQRSQQQQQNPAVSVTSGRQIGSTSPPRSAPVGYIASPYPASTIQYTSALPAYSSLPPGTIPVNGRVNHFQISNGTVFAAYPQYVWPAQPAYPPPPYSGFTK
ncbi:hypothetical protein BJ742DRAFT_822834 [Cladochytrium replicatum]|nr:hypothetical protein BJ742DRAFT_822834 [Cladochytrium replicatum]